MKTADRSKGTNGSAGSLALPTRCRREVGERAERGYPEEVCGLLVGRRDGAQGQVVRVTEARNLNRERAHDRYLLAPEDFLSADRAARAEGLDVVGVWHTHPDSPARPSKTDLEAAWEGYSYVIVSVQDGAVSELRSYRLQGHRFVEETVQEGDEP